MKLKRVFGLGMLIFAVACLSGCATTTGLTTPLGPKEARVTGHKATFTNAVTIVMAPAGHSPEVEWKNELIVPAGPNRLAIRYRSVMNGGAIGAASEAYNVAEVAFEAEAGHEYLAEMSGMTIFNTGYKITDKATGKIVGEAKVSSK